MKSRNFYSNFLSKIKEKYFSLRSSTSSFQRNNRSSSSSLLSANSQRLSKDLISFFFSIRIIYSLIYICLGHHQLAEQHDHWWLDIPSTTIFRMPSCYADQKSSIDVPIKNNGSVDITVNFYIKTYLINSFLCLCICFRLI